MDITHCSHKGDPYSLLFPSPAQINWRLHSHLFQGFPAITGLLYGGDQFFTSFGLSSRFFLRLLDISHSLLYQKFSVCISHLPLAKNLYSHLKCSICSLLCHVPAFLPNNRLSTATPTQCSRCTSILLIPPPLFSNWIVFFKKDVNILKLLESCPDLSKSGYARTFPLHHPKKLVLPVTDSRNA